MLKIRIFITLNQLSMNGVHLQKKVKKGKAHFLKKYYSLCSIMIRLVLNAFLTDF